MSEQRSADFGDVPRHRRKSPFARVWIGGGAALAVLVLAVAIGLVHAASRPRTTDTAQKSATAAGRSLPGGDQAGADGPGATPSAGPKPAPKRSATKAP